MARAALDLVIRDTDGNALEGNSVYVYDRGTTDEVTAYTTESGTVTTSQPLQSDAEGRVNDIWFPTGSYDVYQPDDDLNPTVQWEAVAGADVSGRELGYAEITSNPTATTSTTLADIPGLSVSVEKGSRPIMVRFGAGYVNQLTASAGWEFAILEGSTPVAKIVRSVNAVAEGQDIFREVRRSEDPGSYTYKIQWKTVGAGTLSMGADTGSSYGPAYIQVVEV